VLGLIVLAGDTAVREPAPRHAAQPEPGPDRRVPALGGPAEGPFRGGNRG